MRLTHSQTRVTVHRLYDLHPLPSQEQEHVYIVKEIPLDRSGTISQANVHTSQRTGPAPQEVLACKAWFFCRICSPAGSSPDSAPPSSGRSGNPRAGPGWPSGRLGSPSWWCQRFRDRRPSRRSLYRYQSRPDTHHPLRPLRRGREEEESMREYLDLLRENTGLALSLTFSLSLFTFLSFFYFQLFLSLNFFLSLFVSFFLLFSLFLSFIFILSFFKFLSFFYFHSFFI